MAARDRLTAMNKRLDGRIRRSAIGVSVVKTVVRWRQAATGYCGTANKTPL